METILMSDKELRVAGLIAQVIDRVVTAVEAAKRLGVTDRTVRRMKAKVVAGGSAALAHKGRGRSGNRRIPDEELAEMKRILKDRYPDFKPGFAAEKLRENHGIDRDPKTVRSVMIDLGLWEPDRRRRSEHRAWRERRPRLGDMEQYDGSYHPWLEGRSGTGEICLLASVDDATGDVTHARFAEHEGVLPTMDFWREYTEKKGLPGSIYVDRFSTYKMNYGLAAENADAKTQFGRACAALGVELIFAMSPQAKGRIERFFATCQDRLVKEMRLRGISTVEEANRYLQNEFLPDYNRRFGRPAREAGDAHRRLLPEERRRFDRIFCREERRTLTGDFTVQFKKGWFQLLPSPGLALRPKDEVIVRTAPDGSVSLWVREKPVKFRSIEKGRDILAPMRKTPTRTFLIPSYPDISISR